MNLKNIYIYNKNETKKNLRKFQFVITLRVKEVKNKYSRNTFFIQGYFQTFKAS